jgi:hypothetical protein
VNTGARNSAPIISRSYRADPDSCTRALKLLLEKKAAGSSGAEDHARKEINDSRAKRIVPENP